MAELIRLVRVTRENWEEALTLRVHPEQEAFVPPVAISLAKCYIRPEGDPYQPLAVYAGAAIVGYLNIAYNEATTDTYWISGFCIDRAHQGRGYGRGALRLAIAWIAERFPQARQVNLTVHPANGSARRLYESEGFSDAGWAIGDEPVLSRPVTR